MQYVRIIIGRYQITSSSYVMI